MSNRNKKLVRTLIFSGFVPVPDSTTRIQLRNLRNPDAASESCVNNVGSFKCVDNDEENIAIGWGGHTTDGDHRYGAFR